MKMMVMAILTSCAALTFAAQEKLKAPVPTPAQDAQMKADMDAMEKATAPGEMHKFLATLEGKWNVETKSWTGSGEPHVSKGTAVYTMIFGGRYLMEDFKGQLEGSAFEGRGFTAYDNMLKRFEAVWMDNMSTGILTATGTLDSTGKILTSKATYANPGVGKEITIKTVLKIVDSKTHVFEMYENGPDGKEAKTMEMTYKKA